MRTIDEIFTRLMELRQMVENGEAILKSGNSRKQSKQIKHSLAILVIAVEQIEWVLSIRTGTAIDNYTWTGFSPN
jgi:hypothetical protein